MATKKKIVAKINEKAYPLNFGFKFLEEIENIGNESVDGLMMALLGVTEGDAFVVLAIVKAGLATYDELTDEEIQAYVEEIPDFDKFTDDLLEALKTENFTRKPVEKIMPRVEQMLNKANKMLDKQADKIMDVIEEEMEKAIELTSTESELPVSDTSKESH